MPVTADNHANTYSQRTSSASDGRVSPDGNSRGHIQGSPADIFNITFCPHLDYYPIVSNKNCLFNFGYESCQVAKFYDRWGNDFL